MTGPPAEALEDGSEGAEQGPGGDGGGPLGRLAGHQGEVSHGGGHSYSGGRSRNPRPPGLKPTGSARAAGSRSWVAAYSQQHPHNINSPRAGGAVRR
jgi:hypothetical protein